MIALLLLLMLSATQPAPAPPSVEVSVDVRSDSADPQRLEFQIVRELQTRGVVATSRALGPFPEDDDQAAAATAPGTIAVWVDVGPDGLTRIAAAESGTVQRSSHREAIGGHFGSQLALLVAEPVEGLLEPPEPAKTPTPPAPLAAAEPQPQRQPQPQPRSRFAALGAEVGVMWPALEPSPMAIAGLRLGYVPHRRVALLATSRMPVHAHETRHDGGRVRTIPFAIGLLGAFDVLPERAPLSLDLEGGVEAIALRVNSDPAPGRAGRSALSWMGAIVGGLRLRVPVRERLDLAAGASLVGPLNPVTLRVEGEPAQRWGPVLLVGSVGLVGRL